MQGAQRPEEGGATAVVSCRIGTGNRTLVLCKNSVGSYVLSIQPQEATFLVLSAHFLLPTPRLLGLFSALSWWAARVSASSRPTENTAASFVISPHPLPLPRQSLWAGAQGSCPSPFPLLSSGLHALMRPTSGVWPLCSCVLPHLPVISVCHLLLDQGRKGRASAFTSSPS